MKTIFRIAALAALVLCRTTAWACPPDNDYFHWALWTKKSYFFSLALLELEKEEIGVCPADGDKLAGQREMLAGWFDLLGLKPNSPEAAADILALLYEPDLKNLYALKEEIEYSTDNSGSPPAETISGPGPRILNSAERAILENKDLEVLNYLIFWHQLNLVVWFFDLRADDWIYRPPRPGQPDGEAEREESFEISIDLALSAYRSQQNPELKWRYALQLIRIYFYRPDHTALNNFFETELRPRPAHPAKEWCRSYYGGALAAQGRLAEALEAFALVYRRSAWYRDSARLSLQILRSLTATAEKKEPSFPDNPDREGRSYEGLWAELERLAAGGEAPGYLEDILARHIGRLERIGYYGYGWPGGTPPSTLAQDLDQAGYYCKFCRPDEAPAPTLAQERLVAAAAPKRPAPAFWLLAAAHLAILRGDAGAADDYIGQAVRAGAERLLPRQLALTRALKTARLEPLTARLENKLGRELREMNFWRLKGQAPAAAEYDRLVSAQLEEALHGLLGAVLSRRYMSAGRHDRAFFCLAVSDNWLGGGRDHSGAASEFFQVKHSLQLYWARDYVGRVITDPAALRLIRRALKTPRGPLENFFSRYARGWTPEVLSELLGLAHILRHEFKAAAKELAALEARRKDWAQSRYLAKTPANPFLHPPELFFGHYWRDDWEKFFEAATQAGLSRSDRALLERLAEPPDSFYELASQAGRLADLSAREDETGWTAAYFYGRALENIKNFKYYNQRCFNCYADPLGEKWARDYRPMSPASIAPAAAGEGPGLTGLDAEAERALERAAARTKNPELAIRANFHLAAIRQPLGDVKYHRRLELLGGEDGPDPAKEAPYSPYYRAMNRYPGTEFFRALYSGCPNAEFFLDAIAPLPQSAP